MGIGGAVIVIPCFNEALRLDDTELLRLSDVAGLSLILVDDGSTDHTLERLHLLRDKDPRSITVIELPQNQGKAEAVRAGLRQACRTNADLVGFLDADLSTPVNELTRLVAQADEWDAEVFLGARVALAGRQIDRSPRRHYLGRVFATVASSYVLREVVYDTQCGAKIFRNSELLRACLEDPFASRWSFDVELIGRLLAGTPATPGLRIEHFREVPLQTWTDVTGSKISPTDMIRSGFELFGIRRDLERRKAHATSHPRADRRKRVRRAT